MTVCSVSKRVLAILVALLLVPAARAEVQLPACVSDHMVLQRDVPLPIWGWAEAGSKVTVSMAGQSHSATADGSGRWQVQLDALAAGGPYTMTIADTADQVTVEDVLVGDVWLCSGQSNMAMSVSRAADAEQEMAAADFPQIRHFKTAAQARADAPQDRCSGAWSVCSPETVGAFTATGYFFGRHLHQELDVPIGLINSSWGGTCVEAWTPREALATVEPGRDAIAQYQAALEQFDPAEAKARFDQAQERREQALARIRAERKAGKTPGRPPRPPRLEPSPAENQNSPAALYNGMIQPLVPYAIRGAIWYQGERNSRTTESALAYRQLLPTLIRSWRSVWQQGDFPFFFVQLPNFNNDSWPAIRESFLKSLETPNTGMAVTIDVGDVKDIHPKNKQAVGRRLALAALHVAYGKDIAYCGPLYRDMQIDGDRIRISFDCVFDGLATKDGETPTGFTIAGEDRQFRPARARIEGATVVVSHPDVTEPVAVRYAWAANPDCNLINTAGLPASPFRTDTWPLQ